LSCVVTFVFDVSRVPESCKKFIFMSCASY